MRYAYALKAPVQSFTLPAWVTVHNAELAGAVLVIILLAFAVLRLSKGSKVPPPVPAPRSSGGGGKLLLLAVAVVGGLLAWGRYKPAATGAKAAPAPSPSPTPTVTRTLAPHSVTHITLPHLTGTNLVWIFVIGAVVAIVLLGPVLRKRGD